MHTYLRPEKKPGIIWIISVILFLLLMFLPLVFLGGCENDSGITTRTSSDDFGIYLVRNAEDYSFLDKNIDQLELQEATWISASDIEIYDFSCHRIYLRNPAAYEPADISSSPGSRGFVTAVKGLDKSDWLVKQSRNHLTRIWLGSITVQKSLTID